MFALSLFSFVLPLDLMRMLDMVLALIGFSAITMVINITNLTQSMSFVLIIKVVVKLVIFGGHLGRRLG